VIVHSTLVSDGQSLTAPHSTQVLEEMAHMSLPLFLALQVASSSHSTHVFSAEHSGFPGKVEQSAFSVHSTHFFEETSHLGLPLPLLMQVASFWHSTHPSV